jgi:hypothetical protein
MCNIGVGVCTIVGATGLIGLNFRLHATRFEMYCYFTLETSSILSVIFVLEDICSMSYGVAAASSAGLMMGPVLCMLSYI